MKSPLRNSFAAIICLVATGSTAFCSDPFAVPLPPGVKAVWDMREAHHETTPTRERICVNGLWRFQPAEVTTDQVPQGNWGFFKVPGPWPEYRVKAWMADESQELYRHPSWEQKDFKTVDLAWFQREFTLPNVWAGRRITLGAEWLNSYAGVFIDGDPSLRRHQLKRLENVGAYLPAETVRYLHACTWASLTRTMIPTGIGVGRPP